MPDSRPGILACEEKSVYQTQINRLLMAVVVVNLCVMAGCHRSYYRRQADAEARRLVLEKAVDPRWSSANGDISIDPQSRMFNPFSQDHPPIPPDDATSHQFMHNVDGKEGYPDWHANGDTDAIENPNWKSYLPMNEKGQVVLTLERAFQLALLHSPDLQSQYETLYRSALNVSLERFGFDSQLFTGYNSFLTTQGRLRGGSGTSRTILQSQIGATGGGASLRRLGITGTNFAVGLANTILFNFAGNNTQSTTTLIDFSIIQPLLRGAGRERIMEALTQSERTLLANVRQLERYKRGFFLQIAIGRSTGLGPSLAGNFLNNPGSGSSNPGGFFGLLQQQQQIRNQEFNVRQLENVLEQFREFYARERLDAVQLKQFETNVYREQRTLLDIRTSYQASLDSFKITLGLPPDLDVIIDDSYLDRFELISDQITNRLIDVNSLRERSGNALNRISDRFDDFGEPDFQWPDNLVELISSLEPFINEAEATLNLIVTQDAKQLEDDFDDLESKREARLAYLEKLKLEIASGRIISNIDADLFSASSIPQADDLRKVLADPETDAAVADPNVRLADQAPGSILNRAGRLKQRLAQTKSKIQNIGETEKQLNQQELFEYLRTEFQQQIPGELTELNNLTLEMTLLQAFARSNSIEIAEVSIDSEQAIRIARCLRRDWMNARANLVDAWRNIEFVADQLEAGVDLVFQGDIGNTSDNPFSLRYETGQLRGGFRFDAPIVRLAERNQYRQALIEYQQARRRFYQFEDSIKQNLRDLVRNVGRNKVRFELDRRTVQAQIESVEVNRLALEEPVGPNAGTTRLSNTVSRNLTDAIIGLNGAQNSFLGTWVQYEVLRRNLDFDMGTMQLNEMGEWLDPGVIDSSIGVRAAATMGIELDCQFCENIGTSYQPPITPEEYDAANDESQSVLSDKKPDFNLLDLQRLRSRSAQEGNFEPVTPEQREIELQLEKMRQLQDMRNRELELREPGRLDDNGQRNPSPTSGMQRLPAEDQLNRPPFIRPVVAPEDFSASRPAATDGDTPASESQPAVATSSANGKQVDLANSGSTTQSQTQTRDPDSLVQLAVADVPVENQESATDQPPLKEPVQAATSQPTVISTPPPGVNVPAAISLPVVRAASPIPALGQGAAENGFRPK